jgi:hypothetical protein
MSAQVTISQLPTAGAITGTELVPVVQNGVTVQTTTAALAGSPVQTYTYLTVTQTPQLANSRYVGVTNGLTITDGGSQGLFNISTTGALLSLVNSGTGFQVKTSATAITPRSIAVSGTGLSITNGSGVSGDPTISLTGQALNFANASFNGLVVLSTAGAITSATITGTSNQIAVTNGNGISGNPTVALADNPILGGTASLTLPIGTSVNRPSSPVNGMIRYNTTSARFEGYQGGAWVTQGSGDGTVTNVSGTANQISVATGSTTPVLSLANDTIIPGTGSLTVPAGTTAQRSSSPQNGMIRYNSTTLNFEGYANSAWGAIATGTGTVTSVAATVPAFLSITGSPITTSGTLAIGLSGTALPVENGGTGTTTPSIVAGTNITVSGTWPNQTINASGGSGTVTSVTSANANLTVATSTTTPVITIVQSPALKSATTTIDVSASAAPSAGQVLTATSSTAANWQTPSGGGGSSGFETVFLLMGA